MSAKQLYQSFMTTAKANAAKRVPMSEKAFTLNEGPSVVSEKPEGDQLVRYRTITREALAATSNMVFGDETAGKVFPGSFLWADSLTRDGRLDPLFPIQRSKPLRVTVTGAAMKSGIPTSFDCDGSYGAFAKVLATVTSNVAKSEARIEVVRSEISDSESALLQVGLSAKGWGAKLAASLDSHRAQKRSSLLISIAQNYFTLTCEPSPGSMHIEEKMFANEELGGLIVDQATSRGEIGVVRRVAYGRRLLISITTTGSLEELNAAVKAGYSGFGGSISGSLTVEQKKSLDQAEARLIVIGGKTDSVLVDNLTLKADELLRKISEYLGKTVDLDALSSAAITGFEVEYAFDRAAVIKADAAKFSEQVRESSRKSGGLIKLTELMFSNESGLVDRKIKKGDNEIDSDDFTFTRVEYALKLSPDKRALVLELTFDAREGNSNKSFGDTWLRLNQTVELWRAKAEEEPRSIARIIGPTRSASESWHKGKKHGFQPIPDFGALSKVQVSFDRPGRKDLDAMGIIGAVACTLEMDAQAG